MYEKYLQLARDANSSGDRIQAENYHQHAEHYFRIVQAAQAAQSAQAAASAAASAEGPANGEAKANGGGNGKAKGKGSEKAPSFSLTEDAEDEEVA